MRVVRFTVGQDRSPRWGCLEDDEVVELDAPPWAGGTRCGLVRPLSEVRLCAPVAPTKVIAIGRNSTRHAREMGWPDAAPVLFLKAVSAVIGPGEDIVVPREVDLCEPEGELAVVVGAPGRRLTREQAQQAIAGYTIANDVSARDLMVADEQWSRAKGFDTFCPVGPWIDTEFAGAEARIITRVDDRIVQDGVVSDMSMSAVEAVVFASTAFRLEPGDLILTGTPQGRSPLSHGDRVEIEVPGLGILTNPVVDESPEVDEVR